MNIPWKEDARFTLYQQGLLEPLMRHLYYVSWGYFYMVLIYSSDIFKGSILLKILVELSVPRNRLCPVVAFTKTCSYADGDRCSSNETPLNLISRHQVPVVARAETPKENGVALDAVSRISRPGIAYGSWERVESLADFQSFSPFFPSLSLFSSRSSFYFFLKACMLFVIRILK